MTGRCIIRTRTALIATGDHHLMLHHAKSSTIPLVIMFFVFQRQFVRGIQMTGLRE